jgi:hypothetical protein
MLGRMRPRELTRTGLVRLTFAAGIGVALLMLSACNKVQAKTPPPAPTPLAVPDPPLRLYVPVDAEPPPPPPLTEKPAAPTTPATRPRPTPAPTPTPSPTPLPAGEATAPPVVQTGDQAQNEAKAREHLRNAESNLLKVQPKALGRAAQDQYESALKFVRMTKEALTARNYVYAVYCAEKAATLAALLVKG